MDELDILRKHILESETFCFYPFLEISTRPNGVVFPCCYWSEPNNLTTEEKISDTRSIDSFWNGKKFIEIRNAVANGEKINGCNICHQDGAASMRLRGIKEYINNREYLQLINETIKNGGKALHTLRRLELKPNNLCNLKCVMCNAYDSSQVEKELHQLDKKHIGITTHGGRFRRIINGVPGVWEGGVNEYQLPDMQGLDWAETEIFWNEIIKLLPHVEVLSFAGGEPTVNPVVHKLLNYCVDQGYSKNITVYISSNFTNLNADFFKCMPYYKKFELIASIDGIEQVQEYIRFPSKWSSIKKNFETARSYMKYSNVKILVNITVNILNIKYICDLLRYIDNKFYEYPYYREWPYNINLLNHPEELRIDWIPEPFRKDLIDDIQDYQKESNMLKYFPELKIKTDLLIDQLTHPMPSHDRIIRNIEIIDHTLTVLDSHRGVDYKTALPWVNDVITYWKNYDRTDHL